MPYPVFTGAGGLIDAVLGVALFVAVMRLLFQRINADFDIPLVRAVFAFTDPPLRLLRSLPGALGARDLAAALLVYLIAALKLALPLYLAGHNFNWGGALAVAAADALDTAAWLFLLAVLVSVVASWIFPHATHPMIRIAYQASSPIISPIRSVLPVFAGLDFSPLVALFALRLAQEWLIAPLAGFGLQML